MEIVNSERISAQKREAEMRYCEVAWGIAPSSRRLTVAEYRARQKVCRWTGVDHDGTYQSGLFGSLYCDSGGAGLPPGRLVKWSSVIVRC